MRVLQEFERIECRDEREFEEGLTLTMASFHGTVVGLWGVGES